MLTCLLDVNVLIALFDPEHTDSRRARRWFNDRDGAPWATCPLTENGVLRILGSPKYPGSPGSPAGVLPFLIALRSRAGHVFWPGSISLSDPEVVLPDRLLSPANLTDTYLLALARRNNGYLATFDQRVVLSAVPDGARHLQLLS